MRTATYEQAIGRLTIRDTDERGVTVTTRFHGYAGKGRHINQPASEHLKSLGPLPRGVYWLGPARTHPRLGPLAIPLTQTAGESFGRSAFYVHGDNSRGDRSASSGCIIMPRDARELLVRLNIRTIAVQ